MKNMPEYKILTTPVGKDYELLDSGNGEKLERYGDVVVARPDPQALWNKNLSESEWDKGDAYFKRASFDANWSVREQLPERWPIELGGLKFWIKLSAFKHTGVFPEQAGNWDWIREKITKAKRVEPVKVLNLFGYTGGATLAAAQAGAEVVHVDGSKVAIGWARENAELSGLSEKPVRWILDDAQKFVAREIKRGKKYEGIIMDPPAFGRGPEGEVWKFEDNLPELLEQCVPLLNKEHGILLVNAYSLGFPALAIENMVKTALPFAVQTDCVELTLKEENDRGFLLPTGVVVRATW